MTMKSVSETEDLQPVSRRLVALAYLSTELANITKGDAELRADLTDKEVYRLLEALSYSYRANGIFHEITNEGYDWYNVPDLSIDKIFLTGINPRIDRITHSEKIGGSPRKMAAFLQDYFATHDDDPLGLEELRPRPITNNVGNLLVHKKKKGKIVLMDGHHRLLSLVAAGKEKVSVYYAKPNGKSSRSMIGDTTFLTMRRLYKEALAETLGQQWAVLQTTRKLIAMSTDGHEAVKEYWINYGKNATVKRAAKLLLEISNDHQSIQRQNKASQ